jgi:hypothetical protein
MSSPTLKIKFRQDYGDHAAGAVVEYLDPLARHLVDCGLADFASPGGPATPGVESSETAERADAGKPSRIQRATK